MQKITPFLWFDNNAEDAMNFYTSIFEHSSIVMVSRYSEVGPGPVGSVMVGKITLAGQEFMLLNGGPIYHFTPAVSFVVNCETQEEVDHYWSKLTVGGKEIQCGWLTDKFGVSWQIVPTVLGKLMSSPDKEKAKRVAQAMMKMIKLDIKALEEA